MWKSLLLFCCGTSENAGENHVESSPGIRLYYLDFPEDSGAVHSAGYIHCVPPDIILRLLGSNYSSYHWTVVNACERTLSSQQIFHNDL